MNYFEDDHNHKPVFRPKMFPMALGVAVWAVIMVLILVAIYGIG